MKDYIDRLTREKNTLLSQIEKTEHLWKDQVQKKYYHYFIPPYKETIYDFIKHIDNINQSYLKIRNEIELL